MNRRNFISYCGVSLIPVPLIFGNSKAAQPHTDFEEIDVKTCGRLRTKVLVFLNGKCLRHCTSANVKEGWAKVNIYNTSTSWFKDVKLKGKIQIMYATKKQKDIFSKEWLKKDCLYNKSVYVESVCI